MGERYELKKIEDAFKLLNDKKLEGVHAKFIKDFSVFKFQGVYTSMDDLRNDVQERIFDGFNSKYNC